VSITRVIGGERRCATEFPSQLLIKEFPVVVKVFDMLKLGEEDVQDREFWNRKVLLSSLIGANRTLQYVKPRFDLEAAWKEVVKDEEEGLILKDMHSKYVPYRSHSWLKVKNWRPPEVCDVVGFTPGKNARAWSFGSLVLMKDGRFRGCVGSGFNDWELMQIRGILKDAEHVPKPFEIGEPYTAVKTSLKVRVKYYKITEAGGVMRFPVFVETVES